MTEAALKLLAKVERREAVRKANFDKAMKMMVARSRAERAAENERKYGGDGMGGDSIDEVFVGLSQAGHEQSVYSQIRAGFDNGGCKTRRGTYKRFLKSQGREIVPRSITRRKV